MSDSLTQDTVGLDPSAARTSPLRSMLWRYGGAAVLRCTPYPAYRTRSLLLRLFGARVGRGVRWRRTARVDAPWHLELGDAAMIGDRVWIAGEESVRIGARTTVSQGTTLLTTRSARTSGCELVRGAIVIGPDSWVAADSMVLPGVRVGTGCVVGARSVVKSDVAGYQVVAGDPARVLASRTLKRHDAG